MKKIVIALCLLTMTACHKTPYYTGEWVYECYNVTEVFVCTSDHQETSGGGLMYKGLGGASASTKTVPGRCRVEFSNGSRATLDSPIVIGDRYVWQYEKWRSPDGSEFRKGGHVNTWKSCN